MKKCVLCSRKHNTYYMHRPCCLSCFTKALRVDKHYASGK